MRRDPGKGDTDQIALGVAEYFPTQFDLRLRNISRNPKNSTRIAESPVEKFPTLTLTSHSMYRLRNHWLKVLSPQLDDFPFDCRPSFPHKRALTNTPLPPSISAPAPACTTPSHTTTTTTTTVVSVNSMPLRVIVSNSSITDPTHISVGGYESAQPSTKQAASSPILLFLTLYHRFNPMESFSIASEIGTVMHI